MARHDSPHGSGEDRMRERYRRAGFAALYVAGIAALGAMMYATRESTLLSLRVFLVGVTAWLVGLGVYALRRTDMLARKTIARLDRSALKRLERLAVIDETSGSFEYLYLKARLEEEQARIDDGSSGVMSVLYVSVDKVGEVNDRFGWQVGDRVLEEVVALMAGKLRRYDVLGRLGGTEYLALLPDTDRRVARHVADELRQAVAGYSHECPGGGTVDFVRVAVGVAAYPLNGETPENVVAAARNAMKQMERAGGNNVQVSEQFVRTDQSGELIITEAHGAAEEA